MERTLGGPAIVLALVLVEVAVGGLAALWVVPAWGKVKTNFFKLHGSVIVTCAVLAAIAARAPLLSTVARQEGEYAPLPPIRVPGSARAAVWLLVAFAAATVVWQVLLWFGAHAASRAVGIAAVAPGMGALVALALDPGAANPPIIATIQLLTGAILAGSVTNGLLIGHWHLVDRKMTRAPLARTNQIFLAGSFLAAIAVLLGGTGGGDARADLSPLLGVGVLTVSIAVGLCALCALIGFFTRALVKEDSLQSATGLLYLGVIMALAAEFAAKVRFF